MKLFEWDDPHYRPPRPPAPCGNVGPPLPRPGRRPKRPVCDRLLGHEGEHETRDPYTFAVVASW